MLLDYLVTSQTRRTLVTLLWKEGFRGTMSDFCREGGLSMPSVRKELHALKEQSLVCADFVRGREVLSANDKHPQYELLVTLVSADAPTTTTNNKREVAKDERVRRALKALGAPLAVMGPRPPNMVLEEVVLDALELARRDATVARVLPVLLWKHKDELRWKALFKGVKGAESKHVLGFFLALTTLLSKEQLFASLASLLKDKRLRQPRYFFRGVESPRAKQLAKLKTPDIAHEWGFLMNMELDSFRSTFDKFAMS